MLSSLTVQLTVFLAATSQISQVQAVNTGAFAWLWPGHSDAPAPTTTVAEQAVATTTVFTSVVAEVTQTPVLPQPATSITEDEEADDEESDDEGEVFVPAFTDPAPFVEHVPDSPSSSFGDLDEEEDEQVSDVQALQPLPPPIVPESEHQVTKHLVISEDEHDHSNPESNPVPEPAPVSRPQPISQVEQHNVPSHDLPDQILPLPAYEQHEELDYSYKPSKPKCNHHKKKCERPVEPVEDEDLDDTFEPEHEDVPEQVEKPKCHKKTKCEKPAPQKECDGKVCCTGNLCTRSVRRL